MKERSLEMQQFACGSHPLLPRAQTPKVLSCLRDNVCPKLHLDTALGRTTD
jgi:hypothetical protein